MVLDAKLCENYKGKVLYSCWSGFCFIYCLWTLGSFALNIHFNCFFYGLCFVFSTSALQIVLGMCFSAFGVLLLLKSLLKSRWLCKNMISPVVVSFWKVYFDSFLHRFGNWYWLLWWTLWHSVFMYDRNVNLIDLR